MNRRKFVSQGLALATLLGAQGRLPAWAQSGTGNSLYSNSVLSGDRFDLEIAETHRSIAGAVSRQVTVNGQVPAPLLRWREGSTLTLDVHNRLEEATSIHWHGILLPYRMDGVPGVSFAGIPAGQSFRYAFPLKQSGTYWYHSHSGLQEQLGHYGPIIIDPEGPDPVAYDREYVLVLSDWTHEDPQRVFARLKKMSHAYNFQKRTVADFFRDARDQGLGAAIEDRAMWGAMRMTPTDLSDVTGATYTYLVNGQSPVENFTALFEPGQRVRLRFINASAMSLFNVRIPGLPMTVVQADGLNVQPVETDEFQIGVGETFDVVVLPAEADAYTIHCETNDRSGYARATLARREGLVAPVPARRPRPLLTMKDMGMGEHDMGTSSNQAAMDHGAMDHGTMDHGMMDNGAMDHANMDHSTMDSDTSGQAAMGHDAMAADAMYPHRHPRGPGVVNVAMNPVSRLHERPLGLENEPHRVLVYTDLRSLEPNPDQRMPGRELELHLTGNMERYMWSFDGEKFTEVNGPIEFHEGERLRLTMVNDTMMPHPIHLHGMFFDVVTGEQSHKPRKHTLVIKPGEKLSVDITADALGDWAFHCHLLYHMVAGMMRVVRVRSGGAA
jgi:CopA family copper-resistance protein